MVSKWDDANVFSISGWTIEKFPPAKAQPISQGNPRLMLGSCLPC